VLPARQPHRVGRTGPAGAAAHRAARLRRRRAGALRAADRGAPRGHRPDAPERATDLEGARRRAGGRLVAPLRRAGAAAAALRRGSEGLKVQTSTVGEPASRAADALTLAAATWDLRTFGLSDFQTFRPSYGCVPPRVASAPPRRVSSTTVTCGSGAR